jgi:hypothetical protein
MTSLNKLIQKFQSAHVPKRAVLVYETVSAPTAGWNQLIKRLNDYPGDQFIFIKPAKSPILSIDESVSIIETLHHNVFVTQSINESISHLKQKGYNHFTLFTSGKLPAIDSVEIVETNLATRERRLIDFLTEGDKRFISECVSKQAAKMIGEAFLVKAVPSLREQYIAGSIFKIGSLVENADHKQFRVVDRGPNYVRVVDEEGEVSRQWITDLKQISEVAVTIELPDSYQISFFGYTTSNFTKSQKQLFEDLTKSEDAFAVFSAIKHTDQFFGSSDLVEMHHHFEKSGK